jgi:hypothetical protein
MEVDALLMDQLRVETCGGSFGTNGTGCRFYQRRENQTSEAHTEEHRGSRRRIPEDGHYLAGAKAGRGISELTELVCRL